MNFAKFLRTPFLQNTSRQLTAFGQIESFDKKFRNFKKQHFFEQQEILRELVTITACLSHNNKRKPQASTKVSEKLSPRKLPTRKFPPIKLSLVNSSL